MNIKNYSDDKKIEFNKEVINMYVCGPTVYDSVHVGNIRSILTMDLLASAIKAKGKKINLVHNITDIDDKIIDKAEEMFMKEFEVADKYANEYVELLKRLNIKNVTSMPKVTDNINSMIEWIKEIIKRDMAYVVEGSVYFKVSKLSSYGKNHKISQLELEHNEDDNKHNSVDFALWKKANRGISWESPWGKGRPGWHTECSVFIADAFKRETIDIHGGGIDLRFPHHSNEEAQFKALTGKPLSKVYSYVGHVSMLGNKMSKSLGNIVTAKKFIEEHSENILRYALISTHYRKPVDFNDDFINNAIVSINKIKNTIQKGIIKQLESGVFVDQVTKSYNLILEAILNDINTAKALTEINLIIKNINVCSNDKISVYLNTLIKSLKLLGFKFELNYSKEKSLAYQKAKENQDWEVIKKIRNGVLKFN